MTSGDRAASGLRPVYRRFSHAKLLAEAREQDSNQFSVFGFEISLLMSAATIQRRQFTLDKRERGRSLPKFHLARFVLTGVLIP
jgi:hypothetical protein